MRINRRPLRVVVADHRRECRRFRHKDEATPGDFSEQRMVFQARHAAVRDMIGFEAKLMCNLRQFDAETLVDENAIVHCAASADQGRFFGRPGRG